MENAAAHGCADMSGHYEDERDIWSRLQQTSQELSELHQLKEHPGHKGPMRQIPKRLRVVAPDVKPNRPGKYRPGKPKP